MHKIINTAKVHLELIGKKPLCNKNPERAPWIFNFCFPLCWRCTSIVIGDVIGNTIQLYLFRGKNYFIPGALLCIPCLVDYYLQSKDKYESTNLRRILTGFAAGIGISIFR